MDKRLLPILHSPVTHKGLGPVKPAVLQSVNAAIAAGELSNRDGNTLKDPLSEALITEDSKVIYPVIDDIPILLEERGIGTTQFQDF